MLTSHLEEQPSYYELETVRNLLKRVPIHERLDIDGKEKLEFMSYLRPVMREFEDDKGWDFISKHVYQNRDMFTKILEERLRQKTIMKDIKDQSNTVAQHIAASLKMKVL